MSPYKDKTKQREFQKEWEAKRYKPPMVLPTIGEIDATINDRKLDTYQQCIDFASRIVTFRKNLRLAIAMVAIRACKIRHGGDVRSSKFLGGDYGTTITDFAEAIGIHSKTLSDWIRVKLQVIDQLPKNTPVDWSAAANTLARKNKTSTPVPKLYLEQSTKRAKQEKNARKYLTALRNFSSFLRVYGSKHLDSEEIKTAKTAAMDILLHLKKED